MPLPHAIAHTILTRPIRRRSRGEKVEHGSERLARNLLGAPGAIWAEGLAGAEESPRLGLLCLGVLARCWVMGRFADPLADAGRTLSRA